MAPNSNGNVNNWNCLVAVISDKDRLIDIPEVDGNECQGGDGPLLKESGGSTDPVAGILCGRMPAKQTEPDIDSAKRISSGLPKERGKCGTSRKKMKIDLDFSLPADMDRCWMTSRCRDRSISWP
jgi:hypothetical protein